MSLPRTAHAVAERLIPRAQARLEKQVANVKKAIEKRMDEGSLPYIVCAGTRIAIDKNTLSQIMLLEGRKIGDTRANQLIATMEAIKLTKDAQRFAYKTPLISPASVAATAGAVAEATEDHSNPALQLTSFVRYRGNEIATSPHFMAAEHLTHGQEIGETKYQKLLSYLADNLGVSQARI